MKTILYTWLFTCLASLSSYSQEAEKFLGTWRGAITQVVDNKSYKCEVQIDFQRINTDNYTYLLGELEYLGDSGNKVSRRVPVNGFYYQEKGVNKVIFDRYLNVFTNKEYEGNFFLELKEANEAASLTGKFFPKKDKKVIDPGLITMSMAAVGRAAGSTVNGTVSSRNPPSSMFANAMVLSVGAIDNFREGYALYRQGERFGIIDQKGTPLVPFGTYDLYISNGNLGFYKDEGFHNGMCMVRDVQTGKIGYIDSAGKLVVPCTFDRAWPYLSDGYGYAEQEDNLTRRYFKFFLDRKGRRYALPATSIGDPGSAPELVRRKENEQLLTSYYRKDGTKVFASSHEASGYGDGLYSVVNRENGKYGYMDTSGKLVVPFTLSGTVQRFSEGYALYEPRYKDVYEYSFIDKTGTEVIRLKAKDGITEYSDVYSFRHGYAEALVTLPNGLVKKALIHPSRGTLIVEELFKRANSQLVADLRKDIEGHFNFKVMDRDGFGIYVSTSFIVNMNSRTTNLLTNGSKGGGSGGLGSTANWWQTSGFGLIDYTGRIIIPPIFERIGLFDPKSKLAKAVYKAPNGKFVQGFIDINGHFVFILDKEVSGFLSY